MKKFHLLGKKRENFQNCPKLQVTLLLPDTNTHTHTYTHNPNLKTLPRPTVAVTATTTNTTDTLEGHDKCARKIIISLQNGHYQLRESASSRLRFWLLATKLFLLLLFLVHC